MFIKPRQPLVENQFFIRSTAHIPSLMGADEAIFKQLNIYKYVLSQAFEHQKMKLVFAETYNSSSPLRKHFEIVCFPLSSNENTSSLAYHLSKYMIGYLGDNSPELDDDHTKEKLELHLAFFKEEDLRSAREKVNKILNGQEDFVESNANQTALFNGLPSF